jgi:predicted acylesterase/phospholipase RssA
MRHCVLSVGGARGSFQAGALEVAGVFDAYYGNSVGALNGALAACHGTPAVVWERIRNKDVYKHKFNVPRALWSLVRSKPMLDTAPLKRLIDQEIAERSLFKPFTTEYVDLVTGVKQTVTHDHLDRQGLEEDIYHSSVIPAVFPDEGYVDGGVVSPLPLHAAIDAAENGDEIVIISCHPVDGVNYQAVKDTPLAKLSRTFDIMQSALITEVLNPFLRINSLLPDEGLGDLKKFKVTVIAPEEELPWGMLDFDSSKKGVEIGYNVAKEILA